MSGPKNVQKHRSKPEKSDVRRTRRSQSAAVNMCGTSCMCTPKILRLRQRREMQKSRSKATRLFWGRRTPQWILLQQTQRLWNVHSRAEGCDQSCGSGVSKRVGTHCSVGGDTSWMHCGHIRETLCCTCGVAQRFDTGKQQHQQQQNTHQHQQRLQNKFCSQQQPSLHFGGTVARVSCCDAQQRGVLALRATFRLDSSRGTPFPNVLQLRGPQLPELKTIASYLPFT